MKVFSSPPKLSRRIKVAAAIGVFDGVHLGHMRIFRQLAETARKNNLKTLVITFSPHPDIVLRKNFSGYITTDLERQKLIRNQGVDFLWVVKFNKKIYLRPGRDFFDYISRFFDVKFLIAGGDFALGYKRDITAAVLNNRFKNYGLRVKLIKHFKKQGRKVSSSFIRSLIKNGDFKKANKFIGRNYSICGKVIRGRGFAGKVLGFPTANIDYDSKILPDAGVFFTGIEYAGRIYKGVSNVGFCPTVIPRAEKKKLEVHILDFGRNIYSRELKVIFLEKARPERKFKSIEDLKRNVSKDINKACEYFSRHSI